MKFTEAKLEQAFIELLGNEDFSHYLGNTIFRTEGDYIERTDDAIKEVRGMSTKKQFRVAQSRVDIKRLTNYRVANSVRIVNGRTL